MIDLQDYIEKKGVKKIELATYLDVSRQTLDTWLKSGEEEHYIKIATAINKMLDDNKIQISDVKQGAGSMIAGSMSRPKIFQGGNDTYTKEYIELLKEKVAFLENKVKELQGELSQLKNKM